jgi:hypothetical protein
VAKGMGTNHKRGNNEIFFPKIADTMKLTINAPPNFTTIVTDHRNIKTYLHKYKIINNPMCPCKQGEHSVDHTIYDCKLHEHEREKLEAVMIRPDSWPVSKIKL